MKCKKHPLRSRYSYLQVKSKKCQILDGARTTLWQDQWRRRRESCCACFRVAKALHSRAWLCVIYRFYVYHGPSRHFYETNISERYCYTPRGGCRSGTKSAPTETTYPQVSVSDLSNRALQVPSDSRRSWSFPRSRYRHCLRMRHSLCSVRYRILNQGTQHETEGQWHGNSYTLISGSRYRLGSRHRNPRSPPQICRKSVAHPRTRVNRTKLLCWRGASAWLCFENSPWKPERGHRCCHRHCQPYCLKIADCCDWDKAPAFACERPFVGLVGVWRRLSLTVNLVSPKI